MLKIECDSAQDLVKLFQETVEARVQAQTTTDRLYRTQDKLTALQDEVFGLKEDLRKAQALPPRPEYDQVLKNLVSHVRNDRKIECIKIIRQVTGCGLKEAKDLFEAGFYDTPEGRPDSRQVG